MSRSARTTSPPKTSPPGAEAATDEDLLAAARRLGTTIFHPVGTARMGAASDPLAVVDERLRVRGIDGLRIADQSGAGARSYTDPNHPSWISRPITVQVIALVIDQLGLVSERQRGQVFSRCESRDVRQP